MMLSPSDIHFLQDATSKGLLDTTDSRTMEDLSARFLEGRERIPKVQVAGRNGAWFALNNGYLHILRNLERKGHCSKIRVEVVPLTKVPKTVQKGMVVGSAESAEESVTANHECYRITGQGYCRVPSACLAMNSHLATLTGETDDTSSYTSTDYSDYDDEDDENDISDSEYDDDLTCNVCQLGFDSTRMLLQHQQRKRHFGCSVCSSNFPSLHSLELHREGLEHWSQDEEEGNTYESDFYTNDDDEDDDEDEDDDTKEEVAVDASSPSNDGRPEEVERLL